MKVSVAGAGAGKTTRMARIIAAHEIPDGKRVFCIAFTNAATEKIRNALYGHRDDIVVSTIHSFLYQEIIVPYYYFLFGKHYKQLSAIDLPSNERYKAGIISELEESDVLHVTKIPERAKWVVYKKSKDKKSTTANRSKILTRFASYCSAIYVDEAQDISADIYSVLMALDKVGIDIRLFGDPKQDIKGYGCFRTIISNAEEVSYIPECYRCPQIHLNLSNTLANDAEKQIAAETNMPGKIGVVFETDLTDLNRFVVNGSYGLSYISKKQGRFDTHDSNNMNTQFLTLWYEVYRAVNAKWEKKLPELELKRASFYVAEKMESQYNKTKNAQEILSYWIKKNAFDRLAGKSYAKMISAIGADFNANDNLVVVNSIESIKGLDSERCLFVLTTDLAPYLFQKKKTDNKTRHLLYVALTRSLSDLTILITSEVEEQYSREIIIKYFAQNNAEVLQIDEANSIYGLTDDGKLVTKNGCEN